MLILILALLLPSIPTLADKNSQNKTLTPYVIDSSKRLNEKWSHELNFLLDEHARLSGEKILILISPEEGQESADWKTQLKAFDSWENLDREGRFVLFLSSPKKTEIHVGYQLDSILSPQVQKLKKILKETQDGEVEFHLAQLIEQTFQTIQSPLLGDPRLKKMITTPRTKQIRGSSSFTNVLWMACFFLGIGWVLISMSLFVSRETHYDSSGSRPERLLRFTLDLWKQKKKLEKLSPSEQLKGVACDY